MNTGDIIWLCIIGAFVCGVIGFWLGHQRGVIQGGKYVIHELMKKGSVTIIHTDSGCKMIWEIDVSDEKLANKQ